MTFTAFKLPAKAKDFAEACELAEALYLRTAQNNSRSNWHTAPVHSEVCYDPTFWPAQAADAARARAIYLSIRQKALEAAHVATVAHLRELGLGIFAEALETGNFASLGDWGASG